jgi:hypothetical protein
MRKKMPIDNDLIARFHIKGGTPQQKQRLAEFLNSLEELEQRVTDREITFGQALDMVLGRDEKRDQKRGGVT